MSNPFDSNSEIATQVTTGPSFSFFDSIEASFRRGQQIDSTLSIEAEVQSRWENSVRKYEEVTGQKTGADFSMTTVHQLIAPKLNQNADRVLADAWFTGSKPDDDSGWADPMNPNAPVINPARQRLEKSQQVAEQIKALKRADIPDLDAILEQVRTQAHATEQDANQAGFWGGLIGSIASAFTTRSPDQLLTLGVGRDF